MDIIALIPALISHKYLAESFSFSIITWKLVFNLPAFSLALAASAASNVPVICHSLGRHLFQSLGSVAPDIEKTNPLPNPAGPPLV